MCCGLVVPRVLLLPALGKVGGFVVKCSAIVSERCTSDRAWAVALLCLVRVLLQIATMRVDDVSVCSPYVVGGVTLLGVRLQRYRGRQQAGQLACNHSINGRTPVGICFIFAACCYDGLMRPRSALGSHGGRCVAMAIASIAFLHVTSMGACDRCCDAFSNGFACGSFGRRVYEADRR